VNLFAFDLLKHFVESLALAHGDEKSLGKFQYQSIPCKNYPLGLYIDCF